MELALRRYGDLSLWEKKCEELWSEIGKMYSKMSCREAAHLFSQANAYILHDLWNLFAIVSWEYYLTDSFEWIECELIHLHLIMKFIYEHVYCKWMSDLNTDFITVWNLIGILWNVKLFSEKNKVKSDDVKQSPVTISFIDSVSINHKEINPRKVKINAAYLYRVVYNCVTNAVKQEWVKRISIIIKNAEGAFFNIRIIDNWSWIASNLLDIDEQLGVQKLFVSWESTSNSGTGLDWVSELSELGLKFHAYNDSNWAKIDIKIPYMSWPKSMVEEVGNNVVKLMSVD
jgi:hypothetical protein